MIYAVIFAGLVALAVFGAVLYRSGRKAAENAVFDKQAKDSERVDKIIRANAGRERAELLERLRK